MRIILLTCSILLIISTINGQIRNVFQQQQQQQPKTAFIRPNKFQSPIRIPFPQCLNTEKASILLHPKTLENIFQTKLQEEDGKLQHERVRNDNLMNNDIIDFDAIQLRSDTLNGALVARTATKVGEEIIAQLGCETNATITQQIDNFLRRIRMPDSMCAFRRSADCNGLTNYRTITGVCNNLERPYEGSSQTAFARLLPAAYEDGLSKPRSQSVLGGPLPSCREISLTMGSRPVFDTSFNNLFVAYGQFLVHDITLSMPVTDSGRTPITSCSCESDDTNLCNVIDINPNDPFLGQQKCMSMPATGQGFTDQICALGIKDQVNGNSHYIDLSVTYGSTRQTSHGLRTGSAGLLKSAKKPWAKFELPPGQREGRSCIDSNESNRCFAGGDSRLMENLLLSGLQAQWLRLHNTFSKELARIRPDWRNNDNILYEEAKKVLAALHQRYIYEDWLPMLIGRQAFEKLIGSNGVSTQYDPKMPGVVFNEAAVAALRLHTFVRDFFSRRKPNGEIIDQVPLHDINAKCKLAYDTANNGIDSFLCGSLYDFGCARDSNYGDEIHHRLFEITNDDGRKIRHDIVSINICRGREHGIPSYNSYRSLCGFPRANRFEDFTDTMSIESAQTLRSIYKHPDDVDLFVGINRENPVSDGLVGPVSACIIGIQFQHLKYGDRFFYTHRGQFTRNQMDSINSYSYSCFICHSTDLEKIQINPFRPPDEETNPFQPCNQCPLFDFNPWRFDSRILK